MGKGTLQPPPGMHAHFVMMPYLQVLQSVVCQDELRQVGDGLCAWSTGARVSQWTVRSPKKLAKMPARTLQAPAEARDAVVVEQQHFEARQLGEAFQDDDVVVRQVYAVELVLQQQQQGRTSLPDCSRWQALAVAQQKNTHTCVAPRFSMAFILEPAGTWGAPSALLQTTQTDRQRRRPLQLRTASSEDTITTAQCTRLAFLFTQNTQTWRAPRSPLRSIS